MNSAQKRQWRRENKKEIEELINWINSPERFVSSGEKGSDGIIEMKKDGNSYRRFFGKDSDNKAGWRLYLLRMGVDESSFSPKGGAVIVSEKISQLDVIM